MQSKFVLDRVNAEWLKLRDFLFGNSLKKNA